MEKLQKLNVSKNLLGRTPEEAVSLSQDECLPYLPSSLKVINLSSNYLSTVPSQLLSGLQKLETLDLSFNQLATVPPEIQTLKNLQELLLDSNVIVSLPEEVGSLRKLKGTYSMLDSMSSTHF